jgi:hypothetical protein
MSEAAAELALDNLVLNTDFKTGIQSVRDDLGGLKADLGGLKADLKAELKADLAGLASKADLELLDTRFKGNLELLDTRFKGNLRLYLLVVCFGFAASLSPDSYLVKLIFSFSK